MQSRYRQWTNGVRRNTSCTNSGYESKKPNKNSSPNLNFSYLVSFCFLLAIATMLHPLLTIDRENMAESKINFKWSVSLTRFESEAIMNDRLMLSCEIFVSMFEFDTMLAYLSIIQRIICRGLSNEGVVQQVRPILSSTTFLSNFPAFSLARTSNALHMLAPTQTFPLLDERKVWKFVNRLIHISFS